MIDLIPVALALILVVLRFLHWQDERLIREMADEAAAKFAGRDNK